MLQNGDMSSVINQIQTHINSRAGRGRARRAQLDGGAELPLFVEVLPPPGHGQGGRRYALKS